MTDHLHQFRNPDVLNPDGPDAFDRASFYVEELKYAGGADQITAVSRELVATQVEAMVEAGLDIEGMEPLALVEATIRYGIQWSHTTRLHPSVTASIFMDGVLHGMALAAGLNRTLPPPPPTDG